VRRAPAAVSSVLTRIRLPNGRWPRRSAGAGQQHGETAACSFASPGRAGPARRHLSARARVLGRYALRTRVAALV
jgi:hypothetical protein